MIKLSNESTGECPDGCGEAAFPYSFEGADGYVDAAPKCALRALTDAGLSPKCYLSRSEGTYRVIYQGNAVSANKPTRAEALKAAERFKECKIDDTAWDGDAGRWTPLVEVT